jgi:hypothetical protein
MGAPADHDLSEPAAAGPEPRVAVNGRDEPPSDHRVHPGHMHVHDVDCGHPAVVHGDHLDYVHAGHRHACHDMHYDEH